MPKRPPKGLGTIATAIVLIALLAAALWYAASAFVVGGPPMPTIGYLAMAGGIIISLAVGCGLMALLFYSSRHGYDEPFVGDHMDQHLDQHFDPHVDQRFEPKDRR
jgi:hypothetical protein